MSKDPNTWTAEPLRTWAEVVQEYNRRNPTAPIPTEKTARVIAVKAHRKIKQALTEQGEPPCPTTSH